MKFKKLRRLYTVFKDHPQLKVLEFMEETKFDHTLTQIADGSKVSRTTVRYMVRKGILKKTREDKKSVYYTLTDF